MFKSATLKLTFWYVLIVMLLSFLFSGVLYHFGTHELSEGLNDQYHQIVVDDHDSDDANHISKTELDTRSTHLKVDLVYFNIVVLIGAFITSYVLARRTLRPIEEAHQSQIRFTADASHELRTPLTAMKADTEATLMRESNDAAMLRRTLKDNLKDIEKLEELTDHLIDLSRHDSKSTDRAEIINLENITNEVVSSMGPRIRHKKIKVNVKTEPAQVKAEPKGLHQLITIVLDNAIKYSDPKSQINLSLANKGKQAIITIEDNGIGIPSDDLPHIFERFYRSKNINTTKDRTTGYGLGLPLAKDIAELNGGLIVVQSKEGQGTTINITLPTA
ncbi:MAG TPA: HAMP domain-containing sensor histidine kinase [Candidatus Saccharimonadales bacterium]|nr:HAMP domain-containing sensor histidine kinase [Candidatus Saccharimonadales bacterium]